MHSVKVYNPPAKDKLKKSGVTEVHLPFYLKFYKNMKLTSAQRKSKLSKVKAFTKFIDHAIENYGLEPLTYAVKVLIEKFDSGLADKKMMNTAYLLGIIKGIDRDQLKYLKEVSQEKSKKKDVDSLLDSFEK